MKTGLFLGCNDVFKAKDVNRANCLPLINCAALIGPQIINAPIKTIILQQQAPTQKAVMAGIALSVPEEDRDKFVKLVLEEVENLHKRNAIRFGVQCSGVCGVARENQAAGSRLLIVKQRS